MDEYGPLKIHREFKIEETTISIAGKKMKFASLSKDEQERVSKIIGFIERTCNKVLKDVSEENMLEATKIPRRMDAEDILREDKSFKKESSTNFAGAFIEAWGSLIGADKYTIHEMRDAYESGFKIGYEKGYTDSARTARNPLSRLEGEMNKEQEEFYNKFLDLCSQYNIRIQYHSSYGMGFVPLNN